MQIRKAEINDIEAISLIYEEIHTEEEAGRTTIGWIRGVYPTKDTALAALKRDDLFVLEDKGEVLGAAIINRIQVDVYHGAPWEYPASEENVTVLHTLVISPRAKHRGYGTAFVKFYEDFARDSGAPFLRMDTNARNLGARSLYTKLGYKEIGTVPCVFNGIDGVNLVLLEKKL